MDCVGYCETQPNIAGFKDRRSGPQAKECGQPLEAGKGKKTYCPLQPLDRTHAQDTDFSPGDSLTSDL